ncbi:MAG: glycosyltransferase family 2 protein, partial [Janthinobacterium lividum]
MAERARRVPSGSRSRARVSDVDWQELPPAHAEELDENPWAWAAREPVVGDRVDVSRFHVTAVLVCFDAARWLSATLAGLAALDVRPARLVAIDNGSTDSTHALLEKARTDGLLDAVYTGKKSLGFGQAVGSALRQDRAVLTGSTETGATGLLDTAALGEHPGWTRDRRWLWLLHDDAVPAPDTLYRLLAHAAVEHDLDVTGPKLLLPRRRQTNHQLSEVGVTISGTGRRDLLLDRGEIDQGQRDQPAERLGVSTCGMLVRTAVWRDLD